MNHYRKDIQGLRALAVLMVLLFHADRKVFSIGYLGVDVFILISGFVIIQVLEKNNEVKLKNLIDFFKNRIRRIYPLLLVFLSLQLVLSLFFQSILPDPKFTFFSAIGLGNIYFARRDTEYWNNFSESPWNLHSWSISLELQFYFMIACLFFIIRNRGIRSMLLFCMFLISFALYLSPKSEDYYPYLIQERLWEFGLGISAYYLSKMKHLTKTRQHTIFYFIGSSVITVTISLVIADVRVGVLSICWIIVVFRDLFYGKFLENRIMQFLGLISYSLFMWHYPIIKILEVYFQSSIFLITIEIAAAIVFSYFSYKWIEAPYRQETSIRKIKFAAPPLLVVSALVLYFFNFNQLNNQLGQVTIPDNCVQTNKKNGIDGYFLDCPAWAGTNNKVLILGDSYAQLLGVAISQEFGNAGLGLNVISGSDCTFEYFAKCGGSLKSIIQKLKPQKIVLTSNWAGYVFPTIPVFPFEAEDSCKSSENASSNCQRFADELLQATKNLDRSLGFFKQLGINQIFLVGQSPEFPFNPKSCVRLTSWQNIFASNQLRSSCNANYFSFTIERSGKINETFEIHAKESGIYEFFNPIISLCPEMECRVVDHGGKLQFADSIHLSPYGLRNLLTDIAPKILSLK